MKIATKEQFLALSKAGRLSNSLRSWDTLSELRASGYSGYITIRESATQGRWFVPVAHVVGLGHTKSISWHLRDAHKLGAPSANAFYFTEIPVPGAHRNLNIEAMLSPAGVSLFFERDTINPVRGIRDRGTFAEGLRAQAVLELLSPASYEMLQAIWEECPDSVIEATEFAEPVGVLDRQLVVWEVRNF